MHTIIVYGQLASAVALIITILLQQRGTGLSSTFGGGGMEYSTKRGLEKGVFVATIALAALFAVLSVARLLV